MKRTITILCLLAVMVILIASQSKAIPTFARKYGFNCNMCHTSFTKLNDFGQRYRSQGYQIPGQAGGEKTVFELAPPIAFRTTTGLKVSHAQGHTTSGFTLDGLDLLAAGVMRKNVSFLMIYTPRIDEPSADYRGYNSSGPSQLGTLESANIVFSNLIPNLVNLRVGRFEPAYHMVSSKRSYYRLGSYEVYSFNTPSNSFVFEDNQVGLEATGNTRNGFAYACGVVNGTGASPDNNTYKDFYATLSKVIGRGEGQSAGQRVGVFGYFGWQPSIVPNDTIVPALPEGDGRGNNEFMRVGGQASLNWRTFNLQGLFMQGQDNKVFNRDDPGKRYTFTGGFVELDYSGLWNNRLLVSAMYNWVTPPNYDKEAKVGSISGLVRYYMGDWSAVNMAIHAEYTHRQVGDETKVKEDYAALMLDFDF
jgi:hypothetical protein